MKNKIHCLPLSLLLLAGLILTACSATLERNPDGSLRLETTMTEDSLQTEITAAIADPLVQDLSVDFQNGSIFVLGERRRLNSKVTDTLAFRLTLGASDGHMTAVISDATLDSIPIDQARVAVWNQRIATRLENAGRRNPNASLQSVVVADQDVTLIWRLETARSRQ